MGQIFTLKFMYKYLKVLIISGVDVKINNSTLKHTNMPKNKKGGANAR